MKIDADALAAMSHPKMYVPEHTRNTLIAYIVSHVPPGSFVQAVLENNLFEAFARADHTNTTNLYGIVAWLYNYAPVECYGNPEKVRIWLLNRKRNAE